MQPQAHVSTHLQPQVPAVDLACPGLMVAANLSLVLGYLWIGWLSAGNHLSQPVEVLRDGVIPVFLAASILALRPTFMRRHLLGGAWVLPITAVLALVASLTAGATASRVAAQSAGVAALLLAIVAIGSVLFREVKTHGEIPTPTAAVDEQEPPSEPVIQPAEPAATAEIARRREFAVAGPTFDQPPGNLDLVASSAVHQ
jgi:hypothetical protein